MHGWVNDQNEHLWLKLDEQLRHLYPEPKWWEEMLSEVFQGAWAMLLLFVGTAVVVLMMWLISLLA